MNPWLSRTKAGNSVAVPFKTTVLAVHSTISLGKEYTTITTGEEVNLYQGSTIIKVIDKENLRGAIFQGSHLYYWSSKKPSTLKDCLDIKNVITIRFDEQLYKVVILPMPPRKLLALDKQGIWWWLDNALYCNGVFHYRFPDRTVDVQYHRNQGKGTYLLDDGTIENFSL